MGGIASYIFGSGPSTSKISPAPVNQLDPTQSAIEGIIGDDVTGSLPSQLAPVMNPYTGFLVPSNLLTAPTSGLQDQALARYGQIAGGTDPTINMSLDALAGALHTAQDPNAADSYFQKAVYQPLEDTFTQHTLPNILSALGGNQGGPQSTAAADAVSKAANDFSHTLASTQANIGLQEQQQIPGLANNLIGNTLSPLSAALSAGGISQSIAQAGLTNEQSYYQNQFSNSQQLINDLLGVLGKQTTTPQDVVVNPGSSGLLSSVISAFAKGAGGALSDERLKKDITRVGTTDNDLPLYLFHYKDEDERAPLRLGLMAQDVEEANPDAVSEWGGVKFVDYLAALAMEDA